MNYSKNSIITIYPKNEENAYDNFVTEDRVLDKTLHFPFNLNAKKLLEREANRMTSKGTKDILRLFFSDGVCALIFKSNDEVTLDELPDLWNKKMQEYLGVEVISDADGLMQDVHWSEGNFGYFPSYLLGTIFDGMFLERIEDELGSVDELLKSGKIKNITNFLVENIYKYGAAYSGKEVIKRVCGKEISVKPIIKYFKNKYEK